MKKEVDVLFDPEFVIERMLFEEKAEARAEGKAEGRAEGREEGRAEGREEGRAEGREEGKLEAYCEFVTDFMGKHQLTSDEAIAFLGFDEEEAKCIRERMKKENK